MSPRSFARHVGAATGSTSYAWLLAQRVTDATDLSIPRSGMGAANNLRQHLGLGSGISLRAYCCLTDRDPQPQVPLLR